MSIAEISKQFHAEHRGNCAMAVAYGYARATGKSEVDAVASAEMFRNFGGGKAPNGSCGALYAAKMMQPDHAEAIEDFFKRGAQNFTKCSEIQFYIFHTNFIFTSIKNCIIYNYYIYLNILFSCTLVFFCKNTISRSYIGLRLTSQQF